MVCMYKHLCFNLLCSQELAVGRVRVLVYVYMWRGCFCDGYTDRDIFRFLILVLENTVLEQSYVFCLLICLSNP